MKGRQGVASGKPRPQAFYRSAPRPGVLCRGQHPATNRFEARMEKGRVATFGSHLPRDVGTAIFFAN